MTYALGEKVKYRHRGMTLEGVVTGRNFSEQTTYTVTVKGGHYLATAEDMEPNGGPDEQWQPKRLAS